MATSPEDLALGELCDAKIRRAGPADRPAAQLREFLMKHYPVPQFLAQYADGL